MKRLVALLLVLGLLVTGSPSWSAQNKDDKKDEKKTEAKKEEKKAEPKLTPQQQEELKALSGTFAVTLFEQNGKKSTPEELKKMQVTQKGQEWSFTLGDEVTQGKDIPYPDKNPKEIDSLYLNGTLRDKVVYGIYKIEGDTITYCFADAGNPRPKEFASKPDSGLTLMVLKRISKEDKQPEEKKEEKK